MRDRLNDILIVVYGWPLSGKGTVARGISEALDIRHLDIDEHIRRPVFGVPRRHPEVSPVLMQRDTQEMLASYKLLLLAAECFLELHRPLILSATFSRCSYHAMLARLIGKHPDVQLKLIWCCPTNDSAKEIDRRLEKRRQENGASAVNSIDRYMEVKSRFQSIQLPHIQIDTSPPKAEKDAIGEALRYIRETLEMPAQGQT